MIGWLLVRAAERALGLPVLQLVAVIDPGEVTPLPSREPSVRGLVDVAGQLMPVLDLGALVAARPLSLERSTTAVIVRCGHRQLCLEVDSAEAVLYGEPVPLPSSRSVPWARSLLKYEERLIPLVDVDLLSTRLIESGVA